jgi:hypothetical protein
MVNIETSRREAFVDRTEQRHHRLAPYYVVEEILGHHVYIVNSIVRKHIIKASFRPIIESWSALGAVPVT